VFRAFRFAYVLSSSASRLALALALLLSDFVTCADGNADLVDELEVGRAHARLFVFGKDLAERAGDGDALFGVVSLGAERGA
jgi:hypothetical protein